MEQDIKYNGMLEVGNDYTSPDGAMLFPYNAELRDGAYHAARIPKECEFQIEGFTPLYMHNPANDNSTEDVIIGVAESDGTYTLKAYYYDTHTEIKLDNDVSSTDKNSFANFCSTGNMVNYTIDGKYSLLLYKQGMYYTFNRLPPDLGLQYRVLRRYEPQVKVYDDDIEIAGQKQCPPPAETYVNHCTSATSIRDLWAPTGDNLSHISEIDIARDFENSTDAQAKINAAFAAINSARKYLSERGYLTYPVLARYAYRMLDGSTLMPSAPVLLFPLDIYTKLYYHRWYDPSYEPNSSYDHTIFVYYEAYRVFGYLNQVPDLGKWEPFIQSVDFFISNPLYNVESDIIDTYVTTAGNDTMLRPNAVRLGFKKRMPEAIIENATSFHLVKSFRIEELNNLVYDSEKLNGLYSQHPYNSLNSLLPDDLTNYIQNETLTESVYDNSELKISHASLYNGRFVCAGVQRQIRTDWNLDLMWPEFYNETGIQKEYKEGVFCDSKVIGYVSNNRNLKYFEFTDIGYASEVTKKQWFHEIVAKGANKIYYKVKEDDKTVVVETDCLEDILAPLVCIPDLRVESLILAWYAYETDTFRWCYEIKLKKHGTLNMVYAYMPTPEEIEAPTSTVREAYMRYPNLIKESEVNNPFVFKDGNSASCGNGSILAVANNSQQISQGQFGSYPLYAFSTDGIYAVAIGSDGSIQARSPYSQDIILNSHCITHINRDICFVSNSGLYVIGNGERKQILRFDSTYDYDNDNSDIWTPIGNQMNKYLNQTFATPCALKSYFADEGTRMGFDYEHSRLIVCNPSAAYSYCYNIAENAWSVIGGHEGASNLLHPLNVTDRCLIADTSNRIWNYSSDSCITPLTGFVLSRSIKLGMADILKTIHSVIQRGVFEKGHIQQMLWGSRDNHTWHPISSSSTEYLRGFRGRPYKYFRVATFIKDFGEHESLYGCSVQFDGRQTDILR